MKSIILTVVIVLSAIGAFAQVSKEDLAIYQSLLQKDKKEIIKRNITLSETQSQAFWTLYDAYETKRLALSNQRAAIVNDYLSSYNTLTGQEAIALANRTFSNDNDFTSLQKSYFKKFSNTIGGKNAAKFYQLENYMQEIIRLHIQDNIPFIGELKKRKK